MAYNQNNPNGSAVSASSAPVVIASDQAPVQEVGNVASGATDTGNPLKVGSRSSFASLMFMQLL